MRFRQHAIALLMAGAAMLSASIVSAEMVRHMNLDDLTDNAGKIFRAKVLDMQLGKVAAGGAELPTVIYRLQVIDGIKGVTQVDSDYGGTIVTLQMLGNLKQRDVGNGIRYVGGFKPMQLDIGGEYLLFTTQPSSIGLSTTVGMTQGAFKVQTIDKEERVANGVNNQGLFRGISQGTFPSSGPINYADLVARIRVEMAN